jgi:hypothetical protein
MLRGKSTNRDNLNQWEQNQSAPVAFDEADKQHR